MVQLVVFAYENGGPEQVERRLEERAQQAEQKAERYQQMSTAVSAVSASGSTPDGVVRRLASATRTGRRSGHEQSSGGATAGLHHSGQRHRDFYPPNRVHLGVPGR